MLRLAARAFFTTRAASKPTVTLFTKPDCCLCDPVKFILGKTQHKVPFEYVEVDISKPDQTRAFDLYRYDIPVVHVNGVEIARHKLAEKDLLAALQRASSSSSSREGEGGKGHA